MQIKYFPVDELRENTIKPFNFNKLKSWTKKNIKYEICQPEKIVMIGD